MDHAGATPWAVRGRSLVEGAAVGRLLHSETGLRFWGGRVLTRTQLKSIPRGTARGRSSLV